ncbi:MAG: hypothetical protein JXQ85_06230 [Cognatishimia sp.]|uniref:hypothetical protein n=1 Tax=Cognatishimia sp. TaxID=2211648 RepID=UPI003B8BE56E
MNSLSNASNTEQTSMWSDTQVRVDARRLPCLTELSTLGLVGGALALSSLLWIAIISVL